MYDIAIRPAPRPSTALPTGDAAEQPPPSVAAAGDAAPMTCPPTTTPFTLHEPDVVRFVQQLVQESAQRLELAQLLTPSGAALEALQQAHDLLRTAQQRLS